MTGPDTNRVVLALVPGGCAGQPPARGGGSLRTLEAVDAPVAARIERARAAVRRVVWTWLALRPGGFPWIEVAGGG
jgi:hypothetical protein